MSQGSPYPWPFPLTVENVTSPHEQAKDLRIRAILEKEVQRRAAAYRLVLPQKELQSNPDFEISDDSTSGWMCNFLGGRRLRYDGYTGQPELCYYAELVLRYGAAEGTSRWKKTIGHDYSLCNGKPSGGSLKVLEDLQTFHPNQVVFFPSLQFVKDPQQGFISKGKHTKLVYLTCTMSCAPGLGV